MLGLAQKESMTGKQHVMHTFQGEMPDRAPIYTYIPGIDQKLNPYFGLQTTPRWKMQWQCIRRHISMGAINVNLSRKE
jgi:hypothetical protein